MSLLEYLAFKYDKSPKSIVDAPQGTNEEEIAKAQALLDEVQKLLDEMMAKEQAARAAEAEMKEALAELERQEAAFESKKKELEEKSKTGNVVQRGRAANELQQMLAEDPLPLRRAKINQGATVRKAEKATKAAEDATAAAQQRFDEAVEYMEQVKKSGGVALGAIWWMDRRLAEQAKYLPRGKAAAIAAKGSNFAG
eukprot:GABV01001367.1.p2 GENE.GABV01001367.1~~GABV01001367.1.p2  ORF type:complete len:197 (+),score=101.34 GABV01001367.1:311-901(+)